MTTVFLIVVSVLLFSLIIFVHEGGHFITAKLCGIRVNEFALGMGPKLFGFKKGETEYSLRLLPIGGFCSMEGEDEESDDARAFGKKAVWKRILVVAAGACMNVLLGLIFTACLLGQEDVFSSTTVSKFMEGSALEKAGVQTGDVLYEIDGYRIYEDRDLSFALALADPHSMNLTVKRGEELLRFENIKMNTQTVQNGEETKEILQIDFYVLPQEKTVGSFIKKVFGDTVSIVRMVWVSLTGLVTGKFGMNDIAGPVGAAQAITEVASVGLQTGLLDAFNNILTMMVMITINLGVVNLLPVPALDGGRLIFLLIEWIIGKPVPAKYEAWVHTVGFVVLMGFMAFITLHDVWRLIAGKGMGV